MTDKRRNISLLSVYAENLHIALRGITSNRQCIRFRQETLTLLNYSPRQNFLLPALQLRIALGNHIIKTTAKQIKYERSII